jgi:hypothetical protein
MLGWHQPTKKALARSYDPPYNFVGRLCGLSSRSFLFFHRTGQLLISRPLFTMILVAGASIGSGVACDGLSLDRCLARVWISRFGATGWRSTSSGTSWRSCTNQEDVRSRSISLTSAFAICSFRSRSPAWEP